MIKEQPEVGFFLGQWAKKKSQWQAVYETFKSWKLHLLF